MTRDSEQTPSTERVTVLHVCERFGGGLADAISSYAGADSGIRHVLLYASSKEVPLPESAHGLFDEIIELPQGHLARIAAIRDAVRRTCAEIVHSHSAFAGMYARLAVSRRSAAQVHSPHSFPFERADRGPMALRAFYLVEWILARNTSLFVTCSANERSRAEALGAAPATWVVNSAHHVPSPFIRDDNGRSAVADIDGAQARKRIVGVGRISPQKGPDIFARAARRLKEKGIVAQFEWVGQGNSTDLHDDLENAGVEVTGWLPKEAGLRIVAESCVYVHCARWEGFPVSLLEAVAIGVPVVILRKPYAEFLPGELLSDEDELADRIARLTEDAQLRRRNVALARTALEEHVPDRQKEQLQRAYHSLTRSAPRDRAVAAGVSVPRFRVGNEL